MARQAKRNFILVRDDGTERYIMRGQVLRDGDSDVGHPYVRDHSNEWTEAPEIQPLVSPDQAMAAAAELSNRAGAREAVGSRPAPAAAATDKDVAKPVDAPKK